MGEQSARRRPLVSVVMPTYSRAEYIGQTIRSLQSGTFDDFELLVRDDGGGKDGTGDAVAVAAANDERIAYWRNPQRLGMPGNLNRGIIEARGEFIAVCHDHDLYAPQFLEKMIGTLGHHPTALFVHCGIEVIDEQGRHIAAHTGGWPELTSGRTWLEFMLSRWDCPVCALTVVRRSAHEQFGLYNSTYGFIADVEMWMRLSAHGDVAYVQDPLIQVRTREADHFAHQKFAAIWLTAASIHRRYLKLAYTGPEALWRRSLMEMSLVHRLATGWVAGVSRRVRQAARRT
jgi:glycosyltransferase involved in cell wall biosynthesis